MSVPASKLSRIPRVTQLGQSVLRVLGCNPGPMTLQGTNTYLVGSGKERVLIDTADGTKPEYFSNLKSELEQRGVTLKTILLTHWHADHVGGLAHIMEHLAAAKTEVFKYPRQDAPDPVPPAGVSYTMVEDGDTFEVEGATLKAIYTPGHTTDHFVLHLEEENVIFSGDCILGEGTAVFEDLHDYMKSLDRILRVSPDKIYPAHGAIIENPVERIEYYISHRNQREAQILDALKAAAGDEAMTAMDVVKVVYTETPETLHAAAANNVSHHLQKLLKEGKVRNAPEVNGQPAFRFMSS